MFSHLRANLILAGGTLGICSVAYPISLLLVGNALFHDSVRGSLVTDANKRLVGSSLIAQEFKGEEWFQPRPSAAGYNGGASSGSNLGANNPKLRDRVAQQIGPSVSYRAGSASAGLDKVHPKTPQGDIEAWFAAKPDRAALWAAESSVAAPNWAKTDLADDKYGLQGQAIAQWAQSHPEAIAAWKKENPDNSSEPKPEDLVKPYFADFVKTNPGKFPIVVEAKKPDGSVEKKIEPGVADGAVHANFFDLWASDPANAAKVADLELTPADAVTTSGSGLDPHITVANALAQLDRVAAKRSVAVDATRRKADIAALIKEKSFAPWWGLAGEPIVNVLELNLALGAKFPRS